MKWVDLETLLIKCDNELYDWLPDLQFFQSDSQSVVLQIVPYPSDLYHTDTAVVIYEIRQLIMMH